MFRGRTDKGKRKKRDWEIASKVGAIKKIFQEGVSDHFCFQTRWSNEDQIPSQLKQLENQNIVSQQQCSGIVQKIAAQHPWEKGNKHDKPFNCTNSPPGGSFQALAEGLKTETEPSSLTELRSQRWKFREAKVTRICKAEYQKGVTYTEICRVVSSSLWLSTDLYIHKQKLSKNGERTIRKKMSRTIPRAHTGLGTDLVIHGIG